MKRVLVVGAGPVGLSALLAARERGHDVVALEARDVGSALLRWGATRFFSPLGMNVTPAARRAIGPGCPSEDSLLTGSEMVERVLKPLAESSGLAGRIRTGHRVVAVGRAGLTKADFAAHPLRAERPFRVLAETPDGERVFEADVVLDASGVTDQPNFAGTGGLPARGERGAGSRVIRELGCLEKRIAARPGGRVLLVGHGHSAANALLALAEAARQRPISVTWAVRSAQRRPCQEVADDPLPERQRVASAANDLAERPPSFLTVDRRATLEAMDCRGGGFEVALSGNRGGAFDEVVSLTGYRADLSFLSELTLETSPVTGGARRLARALSKVTDCLSVPRLAPKDLESGEPGFSLLGAKSYGRSRTFLLRAGLEQMETILDSVA